MRHRLIACALVLGLTAGACGSDDTAEPQQEASQEEVTPTEKVDPSQPGMVDEGADGEPEDVQSGKSVTAKVIDTAFEPRELTVEVGSTVTWKQVGDQPHSVTAVNGLFDSSPNCRPLKSENCDFEGDTYSFTFEEAGTYEYYCRIHGLPNGRGMFATLTVEK